MRLPFGARAKDARKSGIAPPTAASLAFLEARRVPLVSLSDCATCEDPCDGDQVYAKLEIDRNETPMITSMKPYGRMAIISTGKSDWPREITEVDGSLATLIEEAYSVNEKAGGHTRAPKGQEDIPALYPSSLTGRGHGTPHRKINLLNGSHLSPETHVSSVLIFPDYKIVQNISADQTSADNLVKSALAPDVQPYITTPVAELRSWPLPYRAVILICSHKRRDKRCHVVAPFMIEEFTRALMAEGFHVDERGDEVEHGSEAPMEEWTEDVQAREKRYEMARRTAAASTTVGMFKVSHIGGHRYAGNAIICLPSGVGLWYGRVAPSDCHTIVKETIIGGKVIVELLRGGIGLEGKNGPSGILEW